MACAGGWAKGGAGPFGKPCGTLDSGEAGEELGERSSLEVEYDSCSGLQDFEM